MWQSNPEFEHQINVEQVKLLSARVGILYLIG